MGQTGFCKNLRFPARKSAPPKCCNSQEKRKSAKISENLRKTANSARFVPFSLSLLIPLIFLRPGIGQFSPHFGAVSLLRYTINLEKREKHPLEKTERNPVETAPRICGFLSLVVVERVLTFLVNFGRFSPHSFGSLSQFSQDFSQF